MCAAVRTGVVVHEYPSYILYINCSCFLRAWRWRSGKNSSHDFFPIPAHIKFLELSPPALLSIKQKDRPLSLRSVLLLVSISSVCLPKCLSIFQNFRNEGLQLFFYLHFKPSLFRAFSALKSVNAYFYLKYQNFFDRIYTTWQHTITQVIFHIFVTLCFFITAASPTRHRSTDSGHRPCRAAVHTARFA